MILTESAGSCSIFKIQSGVRVIVLDELPSTFKSPRIRHVISNVGKRLQEQLSFDFLLGLHILFR